MKYKYRHSDKITSIENQIPRDVLDLIAYFRKKNIGCVLVGGAVRDWLKTGVISPDLDFEIFPLDEITLEHWKKRINKNFDEKFQKNDFMVHKIKINNFELEFAPSRFEKYRDDLNEFNHSDFEADYLLKFEPAVSFKRRDFTCNAMGIIFNDDDFEFIDPYNGIDDIESGILRPCGEDFYKDPVRLLRAVRFGIRLELSYGQTLIDCFSKFSLKYLSEYYFFKEAFKSGDIFGFYRGLDQIILGYKIEVPEFYEHLNILECEVSVSPINKRQLFFTLCYFENDQDKVEKFAKFLQLKKNYSSRWLGVITYLKNNGFSQLENIGQFEQFKVCESKEEILQLYGQIKNLYYEEDLMILEKGSRELLADILSLFKLKAEEGSQDYQDLASLPQDERKSYQAYQFFRQLTARTA